MALDSAGCISLTWVHFELSCNHLGSAGGPVMARGAAVKFVRLGMGPLGWRKVPGAPLATMRPMASCSLGGGQRDPEILLTRRLYC